MSDAKLTDSAALLRAAIAELDLEPENPLRLAALAKAFETTFEYAWKHFRRVASEAGLEVYSPRDSLKAAAQVHLIDDLEQWNRFLNARNLSVHDYVGMDTSTFVGVVRQFSLAVDAFLRDQSALPAPHPLAMMAFPTRQKFAQPPGG